MKTTSTKILVLVRMLTFGGAERAAANLINNLPEENTKVILYEDKVDYKCKPEKIVINSPIGSNHLDSSIKFAQRIKKLQEIKRRERPDCTISFTEGPNLVNILSRTNDKIIISVQEHKSRKKKADRITDIIHSLLYRLLYRKADIVAGASKGVVKDLIKNFSIPSKIVKVVPNSIDLDMINLQKEKSLEFPQKQIFQNQTLINIGRLSNQKGQWHLIRVFSKVQQNHQDTKLVFLGKGPLYNYLTNLARNLDLNVYHPEITQDKNIDDYHVFFLGFVDNPFKYMDKSDVFAFPSLWEGFSLAVLEAAACGLPIVAADCDSGPRELLAPYYPVDKKTDSPEFAQNGIIMPLCDDEKYGADDSLTNEETHWANVLSRLLEDEQLRNKYSDQAVKRAKQFTIENIIQNWKQLIYE